MFVPAREVNAVESEMVRKNSMKGVLDLVREEKDEVRGMVTTGRHLDDPRKKEELHIMSTRFPLKKVVRDFSWMRVWDFK